MLLSSVVAAFRPSWRGNWGFATMTVRQFLTITSSTPTPALRQAMAAALAVEPAHRPEAYPHFYGRVLDERGLAGRTDCGLSKARCSEQAAGGAQVDRASPRSVPIGRRGMGELYQARDARSTVKRSTEAETRHAEPSQGRDS